MRSCSIFCTSSICLLPGEISKDILQNDSSKAILGVSFRNETLRGVLVSSIKGILLEVADMVDLDGGVDRDLSTLLRRGLALEVDILHLMQLLLIVSLNVFV